MNSLNPLLVWNSFSNETDPLVVPWRTDHAPSLSFSNRRLNVFHQKLGLKLKRSACTFVSTFNYTDQIISYKFRVKKFKTENKTTKV